MKPKEANNNAKTKQQIRQKQRKKSRDEEQTKKQGSKRMKQASNKQVVYKSIGSESSEMMQIIDY